MLFMAAVRSAYLCRGLLPWFTMPGLGAASRPQRSPPMLRAWTRISCSYTQRRTYSTLRKPSGFLTRACAWTLDYPFGSHCTTKRAPPLHTYAPTAHPPLHSLTLFFLPHPISHPTTRDTPTPTLLLPHHYHTPATTHARTRCRAAQRVAVTLSASRWTLTWRLPVWCYAAGAGRVRMRIFLLYRGGTLVSRWTLPTRW